MNSANLTYLLDTVLIICLVVDIAVSLRSRPAAAPCGTCESRQRIESIHAAVPRGYVEVPDYGHDPKGGVLLAPAASPPAAVPAQAPAGVAQ